MNDKKNCAICVIFLSIKGERLEILYYDEEEIAVRGRIISIEV